MEKSIPGSGTEQSAYALPCLLAAGMLNSIFTTWTIFGSVFLLFLAELELPKEQIGAVLSLIPFAGLVALALAPRLQRWGWKRAFLAGYGMRKFVVAALLVVPWTIEAAGRTAGLALVFLIVAGFAFLRASAETAFCPWMQEFVPNRLRGRITGAQMLLCALASGLALSVARRVLGHGAGLERFQILIAGGCALGIVGVLLMTQVPGGAPRRLTESGTQRGQLLQALRDRNFITYLCACGSTTCGLALCSTFLPVFLREQLNLPVATVVTLDIVALASGAAVALLCGWAADRVGSRPMLMPIVVLAPMIPLGWLVIPRHSSATVPWCCALYFLTGAVTVGSTVVAARLLANGVVPRERNGTYLSIHYAWMGTVGGASCLAAGGILALCERWRGGGANVEGHSLLFLLAFGLLVAGGGLYSRVRPDDRFTTRAVLREIFAGLKIQRTPPAQ